MRTPFYIIINTGLLVLSMCYFPSSAPGQLVVDLDTCKQLVDLGETAVLEYVKYQAGVEADTAKFYSLICDCQHVVRWSNGQIHETGRMRNCLPEGLWTEYGDSLRVIRTTNYHGGKRHGEFVSYYGNGRLAIRCNYSNDQYDGEYEEFDFDGNPVKHTVYSMGRVLSETVTKDWKPDGVVEYIWPLVNTLLGSDETPGVYLWDGGEKVFLRALGPEEMQKSSPDYNLTKKILAEYYDQKRKP
ncbi:MAG: hypothetical protein ABI432_14680 [Flavobacteriales bacterium]